jgi:CheY-like chemotaxis protein
MVDNVSENDKTILLVDDQPEVLDSVSSILKYFGYQVLLANDGREAVKIYMEKHNKVDLVILDRFMPGMNGLEALYEIKKINNHIKVLFATGSGNNEDLQEILDQESTSIIKKPYDINTLKIKIIEML